MTMAMKSVEIYSKALEFLGKMGKFVGLDLFDKNYKTVNLIAMTVAIDAIIYSLITAYCLRIFAGDLEKLVFCLVTYGFGVQVNFCQLIEKFINLFNVELCRDFQNFEHFG